MWRRVYLPIAFGALQALIGVAVPYVKGEYDRLPARGWLAVGSGVVIGLVTAALAAWNATEAGREKLRGDAYAALLAALAEIAHVAGVSAREIGLSAYAVRRKRFRVWMRYQSRLARVRLANFPPPSTIVWTRGKGFLGECWAKQDWVIDRHIPTRYENYLGCDEQTWLSAPPELRVGLDFREWQATQDRYKYIRVAPILTFRPDGTHRYVGCVSLDTSEDGNAEALASDDVRVLLLDAAHALEAALRQKS